MSTFILTLTTFTAILLALLLFKRVRKAKHRRIISLAEQHDKANEQNADTLSDAMGIVRTKMILDIGIERINKLLIEDVNDIERARLLLGLAIIKSAEFRKESRGAHYREDYPKRDESIAGMTVCEMSDDGIIVDYK